MNIPEWLKPGLQGAAIGAVALAIVGFTWGGWVTGGTAEKMASDQAKFEVIAALAPICVEQSKQDPQVVAALAQIKDASVYKRNDLLMETGWATMPGASDPNREVSRKCLEILADQFQHSGLLIQDRLTDARDLLFPVYDWFTEGFDTAALKDAKALLEELN